MSIVSLNFPHTRSLSVPFSQMKMQRTDDGQKEKRKALKIYLYSHGKTAGSSATEK